LTPTNVPDEADFYLICSYLTFSASFHRETDPGRKRIPGGRRTIFVRRFSRSRSVKVATARSSSSPPRWTAAPRRRRSRCWSNFNYYRSISKRPHMQSVTGPHLAVARGAACQVPWRNDGRVYW